jgi:hypothetical protein
MAERSPRPKRPRRFLVWPLIVLASVLLIFSITANWVQSALLDTDQVTATTDAILKDEDVQQQLSTFAVNQLYANVDVEGQIAEKLPSSAQPLAAPIAALSRGAATNVAENALSSPEVQSLVTTAVANAHAQFVSLIRDKSSYISTSPTGEVTLEYGSVVADLANRLGVDPTTISNIQGLVQEYTTDLKQRLTTIQAQIKSVRAGLAQAEGGELSPEVRQAIRTLHQNTVDLRATIADLRTKIKGVLDKVPSALQSRLSDVDARLSDLDARLAAMEQRTSAVLIDPSQANAQRLDPPLASLEAKVETLLGLQAVRTPGELVVMKSSQLSGVQTIVSVLRNLGIVLPLLVLLLYVGAIYLAKGWRRQALIRAGAGILGTTLLLLLVTRLIGHAVVNSEAVTETVKPAISSVWDILAGGLRDRARFVLVIGLALMGGGILAGPGPHATAVRRFLAPYMRDQPAAVYAVVAALFLLWLAFLPGINNFGQVLTILILVVLAVVGVEILRRQTAREFPPGSDSS